MVKSSLDDFVKFYWPSMNCCMFRGFAFWQQARAYLRFLRALGITEKSIRIILFTGPGSPAADRWQRKLGCSGATVVFRTPPNADSTAARSWLGICPMFPQSVLNLKDQLSAAFGFVALMHFAQTVCPSSEE
jgi:hypothetical protein